MKVLKWIGIIVVGLIAIGFFSAMLSGGGDSDQPVSTKASSTQSQQPAENSQPAKNSPKVSKEEFLAIKDGMSYEEVVQIIGGEGEVMSESGSPGDQYHTIMYAYEGEGQLGANANFMFQGNKLQNKAQFGLE